MSCALRQLKVAFRGLGNELLKALGVERRREEEAKRIKQFQARFQELKDFREIDESFMYLGTRMIVIGHKYGVSLDCHTFWTPALLCEYIDKNGVLQKTTFEYDELSKLKAENKN